MSGDLTSIINDLENKSYMKNDPLGDKETKETIQNFFLWLSSVGRRNLLSYKGSDSSEIKYLLDMLKTEINHTVRELDRSKLKFKKHFCCNQCDGIINIKPRENIWEGLQNHEHFEESLCSFLDEAADDFSFYWETRANLQNESILNLSTGSEDESWDTNSHCSDSLSSISDNETIVPPKISIANDNANMNSLLAQLNEVNAKLRKIRTMSVGSEEKEKEKKQESNDFKFNFKINYDDEIAKTIYPQRWMSDVKKIDKIDDYTVQKSGAHKAICLLCSCDLNTKGKVSKQQLTNHVCGQRHVRNASNVSFSNAVRLYHENWKRLESQYQAHQVYFWPHGDTMTKCTLCKTYVRYSDLVSHISYDPHKSGIISFTKGDKQCPYYLLDLQLQVYGISQDVSKGDPAANGNSTPLEVKKGKAGKMNGNKDNSKHKIVKSVEHPNGNPLERLPLRFKPHQKFLKLRPNYVSCEVCQGTRIALDTKEIINHVKQSVHKDLAKLPKKKYLFFCEVCDQKFQDEDDWEMHFINGPNRHDSLPKSRADSVCEYECTTCNVIIYGDELSLMRHLSTNVRKGDKKKENKLPAAVKQLFHNKTIIEREAEKMVIEAKSVCENKTDMSICCGELETTLQEEFPGCKAYQFGSRVSGLGNELSDLDVFIDIGQMYSGEKFQDPVSQQKLIKDVVRILKKSKAFSGIFPIPSARTPIVKLVHEATELECDISFRHGLSVENTKYLKFCFEIQPMAQRLILLLKKWSEQCKLSEHITTYALAMMAIFFFQVHQYLSPVHIVKELNNTPSPKIDGWDTINYTRPLSEMSMFVRTYHDSLTDCLKDFFKFYIKFNYKEMIICPLLGQAVNKRLFLDNNGKYLPYEMQSYLEKLQNDQEPELFRAQSEICVQDPFDLSHNLTKACSAGVLKKLINYCELALQHLESIK